MFPKIISALFIASLIFFFSGGGKNGLNTGGTIAYATSEMNCDYEYKLPQYTVTDERVKKFIERMAELNFAVTGIAINKWIDYIIWFEDNRGCGAVLLSPRTNQIKVVGQRQAIDIFKRGLLRGDYDHS